jgi:hypothetical protein
MKMGACTLRLRAFNFQRNRMRLAAVAPALTLGPNGDPRNSSPEARVTPRMTPRDAGWVAQVVTPQGCDTGDAGDAT